MTNFIIISEKYSNAEEREIEFYKFICTLLGHSKT